MSVVRICQLTDVVCSRGCAGGPCKLEPPNQGSGAIRAQPTPMGCICPGDATPYCKNPLCPRSNPFKSKFS